MGSLWPLSAGEIARLVAAELTGDAAAAGVRVATDSRAAIRAGDVFVGLVGPHFDGGRFAGHAMAEGASVALVAPGHEVVPAARQALLVVADPLAALQALAAEARRRFAGTLVAITGSNGKTTVKDMLRHALAAEHRVDASPRSYNSQVGVALALLELDPEAEIGLVECGISLPGEMARLERMVRPDRGIFTNVGDAHLAGLGSRETTAREKAKLFEHLPAGAWVLTSASETLAREALNELGVTTRLVANLADGETGEEFGWRLANGAAFLVQTEPRADTRVELALQPPAPFLVEDAALAAAAALLLGASPAAIAAGLAEWRPAPMRLEISTTPRGILLINDAYTADPTSVESALAALQRERSTGQAVAVLGGMAQLGAARRGAHTRVGQRVVELAIDRLIGVGAGGEEIAAAAREAGMAPARVHVAADAEEAALILEETCRPGDRVLLKGSRPERLEAVAAALFDAVSPSRLYVDLDAIVENFRAIRRAAGPGCGVMAVVKSFGYGLDSVRVGLALERAGVEYLAVAYPDEGVLLRDRGVTAPILVQNLLESETEKIVRHGLTAQVASEEQVRWLEREASEQRRAVRVHLKVDTGMARAGAQVGEVVGIARGLDQSEWLQLEGLMTHFAAAEDPGKDEFTRDQIARFAAARRALAEAGFTVRYVHAANSAAIDRFPDAHFNLVRAGLALFGYSRSTRATPGRGPLAQHPALRLVTRVVSVRPLAAGQPLGYGLTWRPDDGPRTIAVVAIGYADGYAWALSNRSSMVLHGALCPVVGRVCMDVTMLDATAVADRVRPGDDVIVFGPDPGEPDLLELARLAGTIPYELLTRISPRVRRIFRSSD